MDGFGLKLAEQIPRLRRYAQMLVRNRERADDLVQDTLERSWSRQHLWRPGTDLRAWTFTIMHNLYVNQARRRQPEADIGELALSIPGDSEQALRLRDLSRALTRLSSEAREILLLIAVEELTYAEVATVLNIPMGTVMSRLARAREQLRTSMERVAGSALQGIK